MEQFVIIGSYLLFPLIAIVFFAVLFFVVRAAVEQGIERSLARHAEMLDKESSGFESKEK